MPLGRPFVGWREIVTGTGRALYEDDCLGWAAELAFFWFLACFPALLFLVALAGALPVQHLVDELVARLARVAPDELLILVRAELVQIAQGPPTGLLTVSLVVAVWSSSSAMTAIVDTLNQAYHVRESRPWWRVRLLAIGLTAVLVAVALIAVALLMAGPVLAGYLGDGLRLPRGLALLWTLAEWPLVFGLLVTAVGWIYYFAPNVKPRWVWLSPGAVLATLLWTLASLGFKWYAGHFGDYQKTYGAIAGVIVALLWLYASGLAILIGAELNAVIERTAADRVMRTPHTGLGVHT